MASAFQAIVSMASLLLFSSIIDTAWMVFWEQPIQRSTTNAFLIATIMAILPFDNLRGDPDGTRCSAYRLCEYVVWIGALCNDRSVSVSAVLLVLAGVYLKSGGRVPQLDQPILFMFMTLAPLLKHAKLAATLLGFLDGVFYVEAAIRRGIEELSENLRDCFFFFCAVNLYSVDIRSVPSKARVALIAVSSIHGMIVVKFMPRPEGTRNGDLKAMRILMLAAFLTMILRVYSFIGPLQLTFNYLHHYILSLPYVYV